MIPYAADLIALRTMRPGVFSILMSLEPAAAALAGMLVLQEFLSPLQWAAVVARDRGERGRDPQRRRHRRAGAGLRPSVRSDTDSASPTGSGRLRGGTIPAMVTSPESTAATRRRAESVVEFHHILSDDGTRLRAWTNDPLGRDRRPRRSCSATAWA